MPDATAPGVDAAFAAAAGAVQSLLDKLTAGTGGPVPAPLHGYPPYEFRAGWRLRVRFSGGDRRLDLLLPKGFPWQVPRIGLVDRPDFLTWPHVEKNGLLCLGPNTTEIDATDPAGVAQHLLGEACRLVELLEAGALQRDLQDEFLSYWNHSVTDWRIPVVSLVEPITPSREVRVWCGTHLYVVGEAESAIERWLVNRYEKRPEKFRTHPAGFFMLPEAPLPAAYPSSPQSLRSLVATAGFEAAGILDRLAEGAPERSLSLLSAETAHGPALGAVVLTSPGSGRYRPKVPMSRGFRPDHIPPDLARRRYFGGATALRASVERADASWIHGRDRDPQARDLRGRTVMVIGCGSLGSPVAVLLARAGVGRVILVDPETLSWTNTGRHELGASAVGQFKAKALADKLRRDFPHAQIEDHAVDIIDLIRTKPDLLEQCDLLVCTTGSWAPDACVDRWRSANVQCPVVYGWMEAHAAAGHALIVVGDGPGLSAGFDGTGVPSFRVTRWPQGSTTRREPACGAIYQPYGPIEMGNVANLVSEASLEALLNRPSRSELRIWATSERRLKSLGGEWTKDWLAVAGERARGACAQHVEWPVPQASSGGSRAAA